MHMYKDVQLYAPFGVPDGKGLEVRPRPEVRASVSILIERSVRCHMPILSVLLCEKKNVRGASASRDAFFLGTTAAAIRPQARAAPQKGRCSPVRRIHPRCRDALQCELLHAPTHSAGPTQLCRRPRAGRMPCIRVQRVAFRILAGRSSRASAPLRTARDRRGSPRSDTSISGCQPDGTRCY